MWPFGPLILNCDVIMEDIGKVLGVGSLLSIEITHKWF